MSSDKNENGQTWSGFFTAFRDEGAPTLYGPNRTPVTVDVLEIGFKFAAGILFLSLLLLLPAFRGCSGKSRTLLKIILGVFVTLVIFLCNFGQEWEVAHIHTKTAYRAGSKHEIKADIGVKIGLRSVNITLKGTPEYQHLSDRETEQINYNERFDWSVNMWEQGRGGFGPFASAVNQEFREAQFRGTPYPILWIAEYFTIDGEGIRWGRFYRNAGFYAHIMMWLAFPCWVLALILFQSVLFYGVMFCWLTAGCHFTTCLLFAYIRNPLQLKIPFEDDTLEFSWGWTFYLCILNGVICLIMGLVVFLMDLKCPDDINAFFGNDAINDFEEYYISTNELKELGIAIDPGTPSGESSSTMVDSDGSTTSFKKLMNGSRTAAVFAPGGQGFGAQGFKQRTTITGVVDIDEDDDTDGEVIQMFRRKSRPGSIDHIAKRVKKTLHIKTKNEPSNLFTIVPRPESKAIPNTAIYQNSDARQEEITEEVTYEDVEPNSNKTLHTRESQVNWSVLPAGKTITPKARAPMEKRIKKHRKTP